MKQKILFLATLLILCAKPELARSFCGFYVAKADTKIFNKASQVVLARQDDKTVITMVNDFKGDPKEFAVVIPVPTLIEKGQIHIGDKKIIDHLDAYTSPRLVEYHDGVLAGSKLSVNARWIVLSRRRHPSAHCRLGPMRSASRFKPNTRWANTTS